MNHKKKFNHLSRTSAHRKAMLSNMAASLILNKRISSVSILYELISGIMLKHC